MVKVRCKKCGKEAIRLCGSAVSLEDVVGFPCGYCGGPCELVKELREEDMVPLRRGLHARKRDLTVVTKREA